MRDIFETVHAANQPQAHQEQEHPLRLDSFSCWDSFLTDTTYVTLVVVTTQLLWSSTLDPSGHSI